MSVPLDQRIAFQSDSSTTYTLTQLFPVIVNRWKVRCAPLCHRWRSQFQAGLSIYRPLGISNKTNIHSSYFRTARRPWSTNWRGPGDEKFSLFRTIWYYYFQHSSVPPRSISDLLARLKCVRLINLPFDSLPDCIGCVKWWHTQVDDTTDKLSEL